MEAFFQLHNLHKSGYCSFGDFCMSKEKGRILKGV